MLYYYALCDAIRGENETENAHCTEYIGQISGAIPLITTMLLNAIRRLTQRNTWLFV